MANFDIPGSAAEITTDLLRAAISEMHPGASIADSRVVEATGTKDTVSTASRVKLCLRYGPGCPHLPTRVIAKLVIEDTGCPAVLFETETKVYREILPGLDIEKPKCLAAAYDERSGRFLLLLEDLSAAGARFTNALEPPLSPDQAGKLVDLLATIHAQYWENPRLSELSGWLGGATEGRQFDFFESAAAPLIEALAAECPYRRDLLTRTGRSPSRLWENVKGVHRHHEKIFPATLQHGDTGLHNTYQLPDGRVGLLDWQLAHRGAWPRDLHYLVCTSLSVADRRTHEKSLVARYLRRLALLGIPQIPTIDASMEEFGRAIIWGFTIGWLMVPPRNYGLAISAANLERLFAAATDHNTFALADEVTG
jgi:aminoglycoside phosphotransferase (APT) family kinase protein